MRIVIQLCRTSPNVYLLIQ